MSIKSKVYNLKKDPSLIIKKICFSKIGRLIPDSIMLRLQYRLYLKKSINLKNPYGLNEKIRWIMLNDRNPLYSKLVDKYEVKKYIEEVLGKDFIIPSLTEAYNTFNEINFDKLPEKFVIKCNHDSGGIVICRDKKSFNKEKAKSIIEKSLKNNFYWRYREWAYKNVKPKIFVEKYMEDKSNKSLTDYKFFVFNGETKFLYISEGMEDHSTAKMAFLDLKGNVLPFGRRDYNSFDIPPKMPKNINKMIEISNKLAKKIGCLFVRIDLYEINSQVYFSEVTFYPNAGLMPFYPEEWDYKLGELLKIK